VRFVAIDPRAVYRPAITPALPQAVIVVDHFHLVRLANQAVTRVRQRVTREHLGRRGMAKDSAWANRRRLLRGRERLSDHAFTRMWERSVSATRVSVASAGWQQVKISRSRSSSMAPAGSRGSSYNS
jgi:transposase